MLDYDLATVYGYETKSFNRQVKNNVDKFDEDFCFQLTDDEVETLRCKNCTANISPKTRSNPHAFTEQGIYMLMTVLKGELATLQSKVLIRTFKKMKDYIIDHQCLLGEREYVRLSMSVAENAQEMVRLSLQHSELNDRVADVVDQLGEMVTKSEISQIMMDFGNEFERRGYCFLDGRVLPGDLAYEELYSSAKHNIVVVDNYIGPKTLALLSHAPAGIDLTVISDNVRKGLRLIEYEDYLRDCPDKPIDFKRTEGRIHDRFIALDFGMEDERIYHCGGSSKDVGLRATVIQPMRDPELCHGLIKELLGNPHLELT